MLKLSLRPDKLSMGAKRTISSLPLEGTPVTIWILDHQGVFQYLKADDLPDFFEPAGDLVGLSIFEYYADQPDILDKFQLALSGKNTQALFYHDKSYWTCQFFPVDDSQGKYIGVIGVSSVIRYLL